MSSLYTIPRNLEEALRQSGANLDTVNLATSPNRVGAIEFDIPSLGPGLETAKLNPRKILDQRQNFIVTHHTALFWTTTKPGANDSRIGTRLSAFADPSPPATVGNIVPGLHEIGVNFYDAEVAYYEDYVRLTHLFGTAERPYYPVKGFLYRGKTNFFAQAKSFIGAGGAFVAGELILHGFYLPQ